MRRRLCFALVVSVLATQALMALGENAGLSEEGLRVTPAVIRADDPGASEREAAANISLMASGEEQALETNSWFFTCTSVGAIGTAVGSAYPWGQLLCGARAGVEAINYSIYGDLYWAVSYVLETLTPGWVYTGYRHYEQVDVYGDWYAGNYGYASVEADVIGITNSQVCGMLGCACSPDDPCFDGSVCAYEGGNWGTCREPLPE